MDDSRAQDSLKEVLQSVDLGTLYPIFIGQRIDLQMIASLSDEELSSLGVETLGDKIRLKSLVRARLAERETETQDNVSLYERIRKERVQLFGTTTRGTGRHKSRCTSNKGKKTIRTWTASFICLADKTAVKVPSATEKTVLFKAGLGFKRIQLNLEDNEEELIEKLCSEESGFSQLSEAGGFELLRCRQNCRELQLIDCAWKVSELRSHLGAQCKIYLRPIQGNLSIKPIIPEVEHVTKEKCKVCNKLISLRDLRSHLKQCSFYDSDDLPELDSFLNTDKDAGTAEEPTAAIPDGRPTTASTDEWSTSTGTNELLTSASTFERQTMANIDEEPTAAGSVERATTASTNELPTTPSIAEGPTTAATAEGPITASTAEGLTTASTSERPTTAGTAEEPTAGSTYEGLTSTSAHEQPATATEDENSDIEIVIKNCIEYISKNNVFDPVDILRIMQVRVVTGRQLEITDVTSPITGETNFIMVDRQSILETGLEEIASLTDLRPTLEVQFYGEAAEDYGGPRKEFFRLMMQEIKTAYFDQLRVVGLEVYETIGKLFALSILQNGKLPQFLDPDFLSDLFLSETPTPIVKYLRQGLDTLGIYQVGRSIPAFLHLLRPSNIPLTFKRFNTLLTPSFSEEGSNSRRLETMVYTEFLKYVREAASGRRKNVTLHHILMFATGTDEEPILGFAIAPEVMFHETTGSFLPTSNTCVNRLNLPRPSQSIALPAQEFLFNLYDYAFANTYYGMK